MTGQCSVQWESPRNGTVSSFSEKVPLDKNVFRLLQANFAIPIFGLVNSRGGNSAFLDDDNEVDPHMYPSFGYPLNPYVSPAAQIEVFNLLTTFQPLKSLDLVENVFHVAHLPVMDEF